MNHDNTSNSPIFSLHHAICIDSNNNCDTLQDVSISKRSTTTTTNQSTLTTTNQSKSILPLIGGKQRRNTPNKLPYGYKFTQHHKFIMECIRKIQNLIKNVDEDEDMSRNYVKLHIKSYCDLASRKRNNIDELPSKIEIEAYYILKILSAKVEYESMKSYFLKHCDRSLKFFLPDNT